MPTLIALSVFIAGAYAFQGFFDLIRVRVLVRASRLLDERLGTTVHAAVMQLGVRSRIAGEAQQPVRDLDAIRAFLTGSGPIAVVDLPWIPVFLAICFLVHPWLGMVALSGGAVAAFAWATRRGQFDDLETPALRILHDESGRAPRPKSAQYRRIQG